jgi:hypothetical protein
MIIILKEIKVNRKNKKSDKIIKINIIYYLSIYTFPYIGPRINPKHKTI